MNIAQKLLGLGALALALTLPTSLFAQDASRQERREAIKESRGVAVDSECNAKNIEKVSSELKWHDDLDKARASAKSKGKLVFWIQALGDLDGFA